MGPAQHSLHQSKILPSLPSREPTEDKPNPPRVSGSNQLKRDEGGSKDQTQPNVQRPATASPPPGDVPDGEPSKDDASVSRKGSTLTKWDLGFNGKLFIWGMSILGFLGILFCFLCGSDDKFHVFGLSSAGVELTNRVHIGSGVAVLIVMYFLAQYACRSKNDVWSDYVARQDPLAVTTAEGGTGLGGWLMILLLVGGALLPSS